VLELIAAGGNIYYLAKFAGIFGLGVQDIGAQQTGGSKAEFMASLTADPSRATRYSTLELVERTGAGGLENHSLVRNTLLIPSPFQGRGEV
jgi:hypothetical protein